MIRRCFGFVFNLSVHAHIGVFAGLETFDIGFRVIVGGNGLTLGVVGFKYAGADRNIPIAHVGYFGKEISVVRPVGLDFPQVFLICLQLAGGQRWQGDHQQSKRKQQRAFCIFHG